MNLAITCLLTSIENPMCPGCDNYRPDVKLLEKWLRSLRNCYAFVYHDELPYVEMDEMVDSWLADDVVMQTPRVKPTTENLFFQRWRLYLDLLAVLEPTDLVFITDGTDVRMLNEPWPHMERNTLYVGSEEDHTVSLKWIVDNHPSIVPLAKRSPNRLLLNAGLLGGVVSTVLSFLDALVGNFDGRYDRDLTDMAAFNLALYEDWVGHVVTGPPVHTPFNSWVESDPSCWFAHK